MVDSKIKKDHKLQVLSYISLPEESSQQLRKMIYEGSGSWVLLYMKSDPSDFVIIKIENMFTLT